VRIATQSLQGSINLKGAQIDDLTLLRQRQTIAKDSPPVRLFSPLGAPGAYMASFGWTVEGAPAPNLDTIWTADNQVLQPGKPVTLTADVNGVRYQQRISIDVLGVQVGGNPAALTKALSSTSASCSTEDPNACRGYLAGIQNYASNIFPKQFEDGQGNLLKGAASQALQNANIMFGLPETMGIPS
jgi:hypothetical protein